MTKEEYEPAEKELLSKYQQDAEFYGEKYIKTITENMSLEEQIDKVFSLSDEGYSELAERLIFEITEANSNNSELYFAMAEKSIEMGENESALSALLMGYKETEDIELAEEYIEIYLKILSDKNGELYVNIKRMADDLAKLTDDEEKLELVKKIFMYLNL